MKTYWNGVDIKERFNISITNAGNAFQQLPQLKEKVTTKYTSENGFRTDLNKPTYEARTFLFECFIEAETVKELIAKYWAFFSLINVGEKSSLYNDFVDETIYIFYQKQNNLSQIFKSNHGFAQTWQLQCSETNPFDNIPIVLLVDDAYNVLVP